MHSAPVYPIHPVHPSRRAAVTATGNIDDVPSRTRLTIREDQRADSRASLALPLIGEIKLDRTDRMSPNEISIVSIIDSLASSSFSPFGSISVYRRRLANEPPQAATATSRVCVKCLFEMLVKSKFLTCNYIAEILQGLAVCSSERI